MNSSSLWSKIREYDVAIYWAAIVVMTVGVLSLRLAPPHMNLIAFSGILIIPILLKPMVLFK